MPDAICTNSLNSELVNAVPLFETISCGIPRVDRSAGIVSRKLVDGTILTSIHFECASTSTKNQLPHEWARVINLDHCHLGQIQGWEWGFTVCLTTFTFSARSESMPGHHTKLYARLYVHDIP